MAKRKKIFLRKIPPRRVRNEDPKKSPPGKKPDMQALNVLLEAAGFRPAVHHFAGRNMRLFLRSGHPAENMTTP